MVIVSTHTREHQYYSVVLCVQSQRAKLGHEHLVKGFPTPIINLTGCVNLESHKLETAMALVHKAVVI